MRYVPKRAAKRWLEGAPKPVLACYDKPGTSDRYTVLMYDGNDWPVLDNGKIYFIGLTDGGLFYFGEISARERACLGKKVSYAILPDAVKQAITNIAEHGE